MQRDREKLDDELAAFLASGGQVSELKPGEVRKQNIVWTNRDKKNLKLILQRGLSTVVKRGVDRNGC